MSVDVSSLAQLVREHAIDRMNDLADSFVFRAQENASKRTGAMADSISHDEPYIAGDVVRCTATCTAEYARYQEEGTGIYGPDGVPITPVRARALRFDWPAAGGIVFAAWVSGSEPTHFWQRTIEDWPSIVHAA